MSGDFNPLRKSFSPRGKIVAAVAILAIGTFLFLRHSHADLVGRDVTQILGAAARTRALYAEKGVIKPNGDITGAMVAAGVFDAASLRDCTAASSPAYDRVTPCALNPWNFEIQISSGTGANGAPTGYPNRFEISQPGKISDCPAVMIALLKNAENSKITWAYAHGAGAMPTPSIVKPSDVGDCDGDIVLQFAL